MERCAETKAAEKNGREESRGGMGLRRILPYLLAAMMMALILCVTAFAFTDVSADAEPSWVETRLASALLQAKLRLDRPLKSPPFTPGEEDLVRGSELYEARCANCHGATRGRMAPLAKSFSPRPPQFVILPAQKPTWMDAYIIEHGIRWSGMPAFRGLSPADAWRLALYVEGRHAPRE